MAEVMWSMSDDLSLGPGEGDEAPHVEVVGHLLGDLGKDMARQLSSWGLQQTSGMRPLDSVLNVLELFFFHMFYTNGPFCNCQSWSFITVHGQF